MTILLHGDEPVGTPEDVRRFLMHPGESGKEIHRVQRAAGPPPTSSESTRSLSRSFCWMDRVSAQSEARAGAVPSSSTGTRLCHTPSNTIASISSGRYAGVIHEAADCAPDRCQDLFRVLLHVSGARVGGCVRLDFQPVNADSLSIEDRLGVRRSDVDGNQPDAAPSYA